MKRRKNASITVFMSLMLMVVASLLFTLLEGSRYMMLGMISVISSQSVTESMFAEYNVPAYQNYHLFMLDSGFGSGQLMLSKVNAHMQELGQENLNPSFTGFGRYSNFLQMNVSDSSVVRYELATDYHARPLLGQMAQVMKKELAVDILEEASQKITGIQDSSKKGIQAHDYLDEALDALEQVKETNGEQPEEHVKQEYTKFGLSENSVDSQPELWKSNMETVQAVENPVENPMEDVKRAKNSPLLSQILSEGERISAKEIQKEDEIGQRILNTGNYGDTDTSGVVDKIFVMQYLKKYTSNYRKKTGIPHALAYEQEYILFGKYSDEDNLKKMANRMLLLREGGNFAYLMSDSAKREEALAMATAIAAIAGIPAVVTAIQMGILASWAYAESIVELRTLFSGGKIAAVKTSASWTVSLSEAAAVLFNTSVKSKEVSGGQTYEEYLQAFLMLESIATIGKRFANLLEKNIRLYTDYEQVKLDCMITAMEADYIYQAQQAFLNFVTIQQLSKKGYRYEQGYQFSYLNHSD